MPQAPYDQLHIYEISGDARPGAAGLGPGYLGLWLEGDTSFLFFAQPAEEAMAGLLVRQPGLKLSARHHLTYEQWQGGLALEPLLLPGLAVLPAWSREEPPAGSLVLRLDPGLVFGNGLHPTTRHCLELLLLRAQEGPLGQVLDLGCGTGILGLAARLLGAEAVLLADLNPLCVSTTRRNAEINALDVEVAEGQAQDFLARPAQVVLANVHMEVQERLLADPGLLAGKRDLILSGVMRSQRGRLEDRLRLLGYAIVQRREAEQTWFSLWARQGGR
ncbi:MAG: 50S ribosomal protein L11 methyltransferase [Desulfarculus sp.]|nr:50S ribosomal protein L11 methyltransferase [Desulfarculus sp.]